MPISTFLNGSVPSRLRGLQWLSLSETGQIGAGTLIDDTGGGGLTMWAYSGTVPCRIDPLAAGTGRLTGGKIDERSTHVVTTPTGTTVTTDNRFVIAGRGTFEVTATRDRTAGETVVFEVLKIS
jgi:hypothetical protein